MKYYFVSDDRYFLLGLETALADAFYRDNIIFLSTGCGAFVLNPEPEDVVMISVFSHTLRRAILKNQRLLCRVIIMDRKDSCRQLTGSLNPWVVDSHLSVDELVNLMLRAKSYRAQLPRLSMGYPQTSLRNMEIFIYLGEGYSHEEVARHLKISNKTLYALRRSCNISLGLGESHVSTSILLCRDILEMRLHQMCNVHPGTVETLNQFAERIHILHAH